MSEIFFAMVLTTLGSMIAVLGISLIAMSRRYRKYRSQTELSIRSLNADRNACRDELAATVQAREEIARRAELLRTERDAALTARTAVYGQHKALVGRYNLLVKQYNDLRKRYLDLQQAATSRLQAELARATALEMAIRDRTEELDRVRGDLRAMEQTQSEVTVLLREARRERDDLERGARSLEGASESLREQLRQHQDTIAAIQGQASMSDRLVTELEEKLRKDSELIVRLKTEANEFKTEWNRSSLDYDARCQEYERVQNELRTELDLLREENDRLLLAEADTKRYCTNLEEQSRRQELELAALRAERGRLVATNEQLGHDALAMSAQGEELLQEQLRLEEELKQLRSQYDEMSDELDRVRAESRGPGISTASAIPEPRSEPPVVVPVEVVCLERVDRPIDIPFWARTGTINIGLDFGTHSTKAVIRPRNSEQKFVPTLDESADGYPVFASPSLVRRSPGGRLYFGQRALQEDGGTLFRSMKVDLLSASNQHTEANSLPDRITHDLLVSLYLSWALGRIRVALTGAQRVSINVAAPMNHMENSRLCRRYEQVVNAAWEATSGAGPLPVSQGVLLSQVRGPFERLLKSDVPDRASRRFDVVPETLAPLVSLRQSPHLKPGLYMMIDMGAGTTELSVSYLPPVDPEELIRCFADESATIGGDQFSENDRQNHANIKIHSQIEEKLRLKLRDHARSVWYSGYAKHEGGGRSTREVWQSLRVILTGGGLRRDGLEELVRGFNLPRRTTFHDPVEYTVDWHQPSGLKFDDQLSSILLNLTASSPAYLAVADGLALERPRWPKCDFPRDCLPIPQSRPPDTPFIQSYSQSDVG